MKFREETYKENGGIIKKYFIDDKEVTQDVFFKLTDELYENIKFKQDEHLDEICNCDDCQYLLDLVREIKIASDSEALDILKNEIDFRVQEAYIEGQHVLANELGNSLLKHAVKLEDEIDNLYENGSSHEYNEDS
jgi:hypothetical protein